MGFCKENEGKLCKPLTCHKQYCSIGEELRQIFKTSPNCGGNCAWIEKEGIGEINSCKDASCRIVNTIVEFRKKAINT
jgi:hypothetical protein